MSIHDFIDKIKGYVAIDKFTLLYLSILVAVGVSAFGLGRLSVNNQSIVSSNQTAIAQNSFIENNSNNFNQIKTSGKFLASKNGKLYYTPECSGAKRIKPANIVWFSTTLEAEQAGYNFSASCNK